MARTMLCENNLPKYFWGEELILPVIFLIESQLDHWFQKLPMNFIKRENQMYHIWEALDANVLF